MTGIILIIKNFKDYRQWLSIRNGKEPINMRRGAGYYITIGLLGHDPKKQNYTFDMESGRTAFAKLISYTSFHDPDDMVEESFFHLYGYKNELPFKDMTFAQYLESIRRKL